VTAAPPSPFEDVRRLLATMPGPDAAAAAEVARPEGMGRLGEVAVWLARWQGRRPAVERPMICLFAASHGVSVRAGDAGEGGRARDRLDALQGGRAEISGLCAAAGLGLKVFDLAVDLPTPDIAQAPAMDEKACVATMAFGMESIAGGADLLAIGDLGGGSRLAGGAIMAALSGDEPEAWAPPHLAPAIGEALFFHADHLDDPLAILARLGGRDIAAQAGAILAARLQRIPVILDGFAAAAAGAVLQALAPSALDHCLAAHVSPEPAHARLLERLGKRPLLDLAISRAEGIGAALAVGVIKAAAASVPSQPAAAPAPRGH
jgi:nicotinate-nucleotide--dimethylbenzimidazole phosphoribosyltransferase